MTCDAECVLLVIGIFVASVYIAYVVDKTYNAKN